MPEVEGLAFNRHALANFARLFVFRRQRCFEAALDVRQRNAPFGTLRPGHRRHDLAEVECQRIGEDGIGRTGFAVKALRLAIGFDQRDAMWNRGPTSSDS